jgi:hypothetical protein
LAIRYLARTCSNRSSAPRVSPAVAGQSLPPATLAVSAPAQSEYVGIVDAAAAAAGDIEAAGKAVGSASTAAMN